MNIFFCHETVLDEVVVKLLIRILNFVYYVNGLEPVNLTTFLVKRDQGLIGLAP